MESRHKSYAQLAQATRRYCHPSVIRQDNRELFERLIFWILSTTMTIIYASPGLFGNRVFAGGGSARCTMCCRERAWRMSGDCTWQWDRTGKAPAFQHINDISMPAYCKLSP
jgi:hypothetical protein